MKPSRVFVSQKQLFLRFDKGGALNVLARYNIEFGTEV